MSKPQVASIIIDLTENPYGSDYDYIDAEFSPFHGEPEDETDDRTLLTFGMNGGGLTTISLTPAQAHNLSVILAQCSLAGKEMSA